MCYRLVNHICFSIQRSILVLSVEHIIWLLCYCDFCYCSFFFWFHSFCIFELDNCSVDTTIIISSIFPKKKVVRRRKKKQQILTVNRSMCIFNVSKVKSQLCLWIIFSAIASIFHTKLIVARFYSFFLSVRLLFFFLWNLQNQHT